MITLGIDIGSTTSKAVILQDGKKILASKIVNSGTGTSGPKRVLEAILKETECKLEQMDYIVATGYGRNTFKEANEQISEISCHAKGVMYFYKDVGTIIDIGGQDAKVLKIQDGMLVSFVMNDKCAAGTGRFLEVMARILEVDVNDLKDLAKQSTKDIKISNTCTVFAESEVISHLSNNVAICDITKGICNCVAIKVASLARRLGVTKPVVMSGGVAQNIGVLEALERELGIEINTCREAQVVGALGAAIYAYEKIR
ncbi:MAG: acyl-CoA dehydratase activase [Cellulosilyticaceae bacterium]